MILVCDECQSRYLVPDHAIGPEGRRVRCKSCGYDWFQESDKEVDVPSPEEEQQESQPPIDEDIEPIPESLRRAPDAGAALTISAKKEPGFDSRKYAGYAGAALLFFVIMGGLLLMHNNMVKLWPASTGLYDLVGMETALDGETLIFDQLRAVSERRKDNVQTLTIKANILNLAQKESRIPFVQASLIAEDGAIIDSWLVKPENEVIGSEGEREFTTAYPEVSKDVKEVNVRFIVGSEIKVNKQKKEKAKDKPSELHEDSEVNEEKDKPVSHGKSY